MKGNIFTTDNKIHKYMFKIYRHLPGYFALLLFLVLLLFIEYK